jgi:hypothetical protein
MSLVSREVIADSNRAGRSRAQVRRDVLPGRIRQDHSGGGDRLGAARPAGNGTPSTTPRVVPHALQARGAITRRRVPSGVKAPQGNAPGCPAAR